MAPPDSSNVDDAILLLLMNDPPLHSMMPDGVFYEEANPGATRFVIVSLDAEFDEASFGKRTVEEAVYLIKAVALSTSGGDVRSAAARIDALMEDSKRITASGFTIVASDGTVSDGPYPEAIGGFCVVDVPSREEALEWAAKIAVACRCAQEVRELLPDPAI